MKKLFMSIFAVVFAVFALGTSTFAWFSMNKTVTATGMQVTATAEGSLVIATTAPAADASTTEVDFTSTGLQTLFASTHDLAFSTGLKYVTNQEEVDAASGLAHGATSLTFADAVNGTKVYYHDYQVYIAAAGEAMEHQDLTITISDPTGLTDLNAAVSVDFYYSTNGTAPTIGSGAFAGTLNLAGLDASVNDASTGKAELILSDITIPKANGAAGIVVIMRVYVDGALLKSASPSNTTYVNTVAIPEIANQTLTVEFVASTH